jgi:hypothetical protein
MELRHFAKPDTKYRARCEHPPESLATKDAPFEDVVILPPDPAAVADGLLRDLTTPGERATSAGECRTFAEARLAFPRRAIRRNAARRLVAQLVEQWASPDADAVARPVRAWVAEQWSTLELGPQPLTTRLQADVTAALGRTPEEAFAAVAGPTALLRPEAVADVRARLDQAVNAVAAALTAATDRLVREWGTRLARPAVALVEQPDFRLAGAEAAVRLLIEGVEQSLAHVGPAADGWLRRADSARQAGGDVGLRSYPRWRYQGLLLRQIAAVYVALRRQLADQIAELGLCRTRLVAMLDAVKAPAPDPTPSNWLLPPGCATVVDAAERLAHPDDVRELDRRAQHHLQESAGGLARACLTAGDLSKALGPALVELAEAIVEPRRGDDAAALFLARHPGPEGLQTLWAAAAPPLAGDEVTTIAAPESLRDMARQAFGPDVAFTPSADEVAVVRSVRLPLTALPPLGPDGKAAFQKRKAAGKTSHARMDVLFAD